MIHLENDYIKLSIDPSRGGAITSLLSKQSDNEWIYYDSSRKSENDLLEIYDDVWCGGFEELFPNDASGIINGRSLKDHGELWSQSWDLIEMNSSSIVLHVECSTVPARILKKIGLLPDKPGLSIYYIIQNLSGEEYPYLFKLHPAMRIEAGDELLLGGGTVIQVDSAFSKIIDSNKPFSWPSFLANDGAIKNLAIVPDKKEQLQEFIYVKDLSGPWCGLKRKNTNEEFILEFPREIFPYCWFFMSFGGWRDHYTVVMEPCTNYPKDLRTAINNGTTAIMKPFAELAFEISINLRYSNA